MTDLDAPLLAFLREHLGDPMLAYAEAPRGLGGGAFTEVHRFALAGATGPWQQPLVLRLYPTLADDDQARLEHAFHDGVGRAGVPAPPILLRGDGHDALGRPLLIMPLLDGRAFLRGIRWDQFARDFPRLVVIWGKAVAELMGRLHELAPEPVVALAAEQGLTPAAISTGRHLRAVERQLDACGGHGLGAALDWLRSNEPDPPHSASIVHGDLWPGNVLMRRRTVTGVVDWDKAAVGDPALDVGFAMAGLSLMPAPFPPPPPIAQGIHVAGKAIARDVQRAYTQSRPIDTERIRYYEALRCIVELAPVMAHRAGSTGAAHPGPPPPWTAGVAALKEHFTSISGVAVEDPPTVA